MRIDTPQIIDFSESQVASATGHGYLSSGDWTTFNNKQSSGSYVSTVDTGAFVTTGQTGVYSNADLLDGQHGNYYLNAANFTGTLNTGVVVDADTLSGQMASYFVSTGDNRNLGLSGFNLFKNFAQYFRYETQDMYCYPNVAVYSPGPAYRTGAIVFNTPILRSSNQMFCVHVRGYNYNNVGVENVIFGGYVTSTYSGNIDGLPGSVRFTSMVNCGNTIAKKTLGINKSGYFAIAFYDTGYWHGHVRYAADVWVTFSNPSLYTSGWGWTNETGVNFGFLDKTEMSTSGEASFVTTGQTGSFITTGLTGSFVTTSQTGHLFNLVRSEVTGLSSGASSGIYVLIPNSRTYTTGSKQLSVFVNGDIQYISDEYVETNNSGVTFMYNVPQDAKVLFNIID